MRDDKPAIDVMEQGPFIVKGLKKLTGADGSAVPMEKDVIALCRCGASKNKPFCDGTHSDIGFSGTCERTDDTPAEEGEGEVQDRFFSEAEIVITKDGPLQVRGGIALNDERQPPTTNHYSLCRCGASKDKPFCDGTHKEIGFQG